MAKRWWTVAVAAGLALPVQAQEAPKRQAQPVSPQAASDPLTALYHIAGVRDDGTADYNGKATIFLCSNYSAVAEKIRFVVRNYNATILKDMTYDIGARRTLTAATHNEYYVEADVSLATGSVPGGSATISATTTNMTCTALVVDATSTNPNFAVALRLQRFNPISGSQE